MVVALVGWLLAACGGSDDDDLESTNWSLVSLAGQDAAPDTSVAMRLGNEGRLAGSAGCNTFIGTWQTGDDSSLTLDPGGMTLMACPEPVMLQEAAFLAALTDTASFDRDDDELTLRNADDDDIAVLTKLVNAELTDTNWQAVYVNSGQQAVVGVLPDATITAVFGDDDTLTGNGGCNQYNTGYTTDDDAMTIERPGATLMACDQPILDQETAYFDALEQVATFELDARTLSLRDAHGALLVLFKMVDEE
jgi:heat shock protein HslJ